jgi:hypothetical protein
MRKIRILCLIVLGMVYTATIAQNKITGVYDASKNSFASADENYRVGLFTDGKAIFSFADKQGVIDRTGKILLPAQYDKIYPFEGNVARVVLANKYGLVLLSGKELLTPVYQYIRSFKEGFAVFEENLKSKFGMGLLNNKGKITVEPNYSFLSDVTEDRLTFYREGIMGFMDTEGKEIYAVEYIRYAQHNATPICRDIINGTNDLRSREYFYFGIRGIDNSPVFEFSEGLTLAYIRKNGNFKFGYIDKEGNTVIPFHCEWGAPFQQGIAKVKIKGKYGVIDKTGNYLVQPTYELVQPHPQGYIVRENGSFGFITKEGASKVPCIYSSMKPGYGNRLIVAKGTDTTVVNEYYTHIIPLYGIITTSDSVCIPLQYVAIEYLFENLFAAAKPTIIKYDFSWVAQKNWGVVKDNGEVILPFDYDGISVINNYIGVAANHLFSYSLNTGIPRYDYVGNYILFSAKGKSSDKSYSYYHLIEMQGDWYNRMPEQKCPMPYLKFEHGLLKVMYIKNNQIPSNVMPGIGHGNKDYEVLYLDSLGRETKGR